MSSCHSFTTSTTYGRTEFFGFARDAIRGGMRKTVAPVGDGGIWFKLWVRSMDDPSLALLSIADYGRWCKFGVYTKEHGTDGVVTVSKPSDPSISHPLQAAFQVGGFDEIIGAVIRAPNIEITEVSPETGASVTFKIKWRNWWKYQGDFSTNRVRKHRAKKEQNETVQKRREKKRGEENLQKREDDPAGGALVTQESMAETRPEPDDNHRGPISHTASEAQAMRLKLLDERHQLLPPRDGFRIWPAAQRLFSQGLPLDTATSILSAMVSRWATILHPWAYLQAVLDKEYREYKIQVQLADHEATKKLPANVSLIGEVMRRAAEGGTTDAGDKSDPEPWS